MSSADLAKLDWTTLQADVRSRLPGGVADVRFADNEAGLVVTVGWLDPGRARDHGAFSGRAEVDANGDNIDDACAAIAVGNELYSCYVATIYP